MPSKGSGAAHRGRPVRIAWIPEHEQTEQGQQETADEDVAQGVAVVDAADDLFDGHRGEYDLCDEYPDPSNPTHGEDAAEDRDGDDRCHAPERERQIDDLTGGVPVSVTGVVGDRDDALDGERGCRDDRRDRRDRGGTGPDRRSSGGGCGGGRRP